MNVKEFRVTSWHFVVCSVAEHPCSFRAFSGWQVNIIVPLSHGGSSYSCIKLEFSPPPPEGLLSWCSSSLIRHHHLYRCMLERRANLFLWIMTLPAHSELLFYFQHTGFLLKHFPLAQVLSSSFSGHLNTFSSSMFYSTYFFPPSLSRVCSGAASPHRRFIIVSGDRRYFQCCCMSSLLCITPLIGLLLLVRCLKLCGGLWEWGWEDGVQKCSVMSDIRHVGYYSALRLTVWDWCLCKLLRILGLSQFCTGFEHAPSAPLDSTLPNSSQFSEAQLTALSVSGTIFLTPTVTL